jgi:Zn-dependent membrane protease YugP
MNYGVLFQYWWLLVPAIVLGMIAQAMVRNTYRKYSAVKTERGITGVEAARRILDSRGLQNIPIESITGALSDHYDPRSKTLRLSEGIYRGDNAAAIGVAAHEAGHAIQHSRSYFPLAVRNAVYPVASFGSNLGPIIVIGGLLFGALQPLITVGIVLFAFAVAFSIITLPVEINASATAMQILRKDHYLNEDELQAAKKVLTAAALTYVAAALASVLTLMRLILLGRRS